MAETHGHRCTARDMTRIIGAEPRDHRTSAAGLGTDEACQRTITLTAGPRRAEGVCVGGVGATALTHCP